MRRLICTVFAVAATGFVGLAPAPPADATLTGPTYLPVADQTSTPVAINEAGDIAVSIYFTGATGAAAAVWRRSGAVEHLGTLGGAHATATDLNAWGEIVGYSTTASGEQHAFRWDPLAGMVDLGTPGVESQATAINDHGEVVGWILDTMDRRHIVRWGPTNLFTDLGRFGALHASPADINEAGQITGTRSTVGGDVRAVFWDPITGMALIPTLGGGAQQNSFANALNDRGEVVGDSPIPNGDVHAFRWKLGEPIEDLGTLGGPFARALAINNHGRIIGFSYTTLFTRAFVKDPGLPMQPVGDFGDELFVNEVFDVNDHGQVVGSATLPPCCIPGGAIVWDRVTSTRSLESPPAGGGAIAINDRGEIAGWNRAADGGRLAVRWTVDTPTQVSWTAAEYARLQQISDFYGYSATDMPKASVGAVAYILAFVPAPGPTPVTLDPAGTDTTQIITWESDEIAALEAVKRRFALDDRDAMRFAIYLLGYLAAIQGH